MGNGYIVSIDPGETSGYCVYDCPSKIILDYGIEKGDAMAYLFQTYLRTLNVEVAIVEKFVLFGDMAKPLTGDEMYTSQLIGKLKFIAEGFKVPVYMSEPMKKIPFGDKRLKVLNLYTTPIHVRDSIRHLLSYLAQTKGVNPNTLEIRKPVQKLLSKS